MFPQEKSYRTFSMTLRVPPGFDVFVKSSTKIFNIFYSWCYKNKSCNKYEAEKALSKSLKEKFPGFPTGILQTIRDVACGNVKANKSRSQCKKDSKSIPLDLRSITLYKDSPELSFAWQGKRQATKQPFEVPVWFAVKYPKRIFKYAIISWSKMENSWILNLTYDVPDDPMEDLTQIDPKDVHGLDCGIYNIATTSEAEMFSSAQLRAKQREILFVNRELQSKGTWSAKKRLRKRSGQQRRFAKDLNHVVSKKIVNSNGKMFVFENLRDIPKNYSRQFNKRLSNWSYYELQQFTEYKAKTLGKPVVYVDPRYTSQMCSECNYIDSKNRKGSKFHCLQCGHREHADVNAAKNIRDLFLNPEKSRENIRIATEQSLLQKQQRLERKRIRQGTVNSPNAGSRPRIVRKNNPGAEQLQ